MCMSVLPGYPWRPVEGIRSVEFQMAVSHNMGAENQTQILGKSSQCSKLLSHLLPRFACFLFLFLIFTHE